MTYVLYAFLWLSASTVAYVLFRFAWLRSIKNWTVEDRRVNILVSLIAAPLWIVISLIILIYSIVFKSDGEQEAKW